MLTGTVFNPAPWTESSNPAIASTPLTLITSVGLADVDDSTATEAWVSLSTSASLGEYAACDPTRDALQLLSSYNGGSQPLVQGAWIAAQCVLVLSPLNGQPSVTLAQMSTAIGAVQYANLNALDPTNRIQWGTGAPYPVALTRGTTLTVFDAGGGTSIRKSTATSGLLVLAPFDNPPVINTALIYAAGGLFSSIDPYALVGLVTTGALDYNQLKLTIVKPNVGTSIAVFSFDLTPVVASVGVFAGGQITDVDSTTPPSTGVDIQWVNNGVAYPLSSWVAATGGITNALFLYSTVTPSTLTVSLNAGAVRGTYLFRFFYGSVGVSADFYIDIREAACTLSGATNFALTLNPGHAIEEVSAFVVGFSYI